MCLYVGGGGGGWQGPTGSALKNTYTRITLFVGNLCVDMEIGLQGSG